MATTQPKYNQATCPVDYMGYPTKYEQEDQMLALRLWNRGVGVCIESKIEPAISICQELAVMPAYEILH